MNNKIPEFLAVGHVCHDQTPAGYLPGGAAAYAGLLAARLGHRAAVLTSYGPDFLFAPLFGGLTLQVVAAGQTTVFENRYHDGERHQLLHRKASDLSPAHLPEDWRKVGTVLLGPICDEVSLDFLEVFENAIVCACPQGWMRQWDEAGRVSPKPLEDWAPLARASIISMSEADVGGDWGLIEKIAATANLLIVTQGKQGATIFFRGEREHFPACPANEADPTGAGDVFAAAFSLHFSKEKNVRHAARFAHAAASLNVEGQGMGGIPGWEAVERRLAECG